MTQLLKRWSSKGAGTDVWFGQEVDELPDFKLSPLKPNVFASYTGPDLGLVTCHDLELKLVNDETPVPADKKSVSNTGSLIAGAKSWRLKNRKAYGISMSLYDQHPVSGKISGDPIADAFGLCARENSAIMIVADGVNWGDKPRLAARCAVYGTMNYVNEQLFLSSSDSTVKTTRDVFRLLLRSLDEAQATILRHEGGLTTLCVAFVCPLKTTRRRAVCVVSVGDSLAFVLSRRHGMREVTMGSRDVTTERDIRDAGGALGPVRNGVDPELHNLTLSITLVDPGDIVFLTSDGISDNFDPVVTKTAVASPPPKTSVSDCNGTKSPVRDELKQVCSETVEKPADNVSASDENTDSKSSKPSLESVDPSPSPASPTSPGIKTYPDDDPGCVSADGRPVMTPCERHRYAVKEMERIVMEFELFTEGACSAQELTGALVQHVLKLTDKKRKVLENPELYRRRRKLDQAERERRDAEIVAQLARSPGKLDHATAIAYEVGEYHGDEDEDYCVDEEEEIEEDRKTNILQTEGETTDVDILQFTTNHFS